MIKLNAGFSRKVGEANYGSRGANRELGNLRATFNRVVSFFNLLTVNPFKNLSKLDVSERPIRPLSRDEEKRLLDACSGNLELDAYVRLALDTGCRAGEISNLLWENLDLNEGTGPSSAIPFGRARPGATGSSRSRPRR